MTCLTRPSCFGTVGSFQVFQWPEAVGVEENGVLSFQLEVRGETRVFA